MSRKISKATEKYVQITEKDFQDAVKEGVDPEYALKPGRYRVTRGRFAGKIKPDDTDPKNIKVRVTMYLDADIVEYYKRKAQEPDAAAYQTQINNALRRAIEQELAARKQSSACSPSDLLGDRAFLEAVAERVSVLLKQES